MSWTSITAGNLAGLFALRGFSRGLDRQGHCLEEWGSLQPARLSLVLFIDDLHFAVLHAAVAMVYLASHMLMMLHLLALRIIHTRVHDMVLPSEPDIALRRATTLT